MTTQSPSGELSPAVWRGSVAALVDAALRTDWPLAVHLDGLGRSPLTYMQRVVEWLKSPPSHLFCEPVTSDLRSGSVGALPRCVGESGVLGAGDRATNQSQVLRGDSSLALVALVAAFHPGRVGQVYSRRAWFAHNSGIWPISFGAKALTSIPARLEQHAPMLGYLCTDPVQGPWFGVSDPLGNGIVSWASPQAAERDVLRQYGGNRNGLVRLSDLWALACALELGSFADGARAVHLARERILTEAPLDWSASTIRQQSQRAEQIARDLLLPLARRVVEIAYNPGVPRPEGQQRQPDKEVAGTAPLPPVTGLGRPRRTAMDLEID